LHESGYSTLTLSQAVHSIQSGEGIPNRKFVITFDDGYETVYSEAFPWLQHFGMTATVFLTVGPPGARTADGRLPSLEGRSMLAWSEVRQMHHAGIEFGAHTLTHPDLTRIPVDRAESEVRDSKAIIEDALSNPVTSFAYPLGRFNRITREQVSRHFRNACSDKLGFVTARSDPFALERVDAYYLRTERLADVMMTRWFPWYIRARAVPRQIKRALQHG
jgi:peptidoglycan/xylan/chitin deacetylase (PgdA/CDA1 family)